MKPIRRSKGSVHQSNSFTDLKALNGRPGAGSGGGGGGARPLFDFFRDDLMLDRKQAPHS
ncbi:unnamed protein product, partial [Dibothriocephalus latus]